MNGPVLEALERALLELVGEGETGRFSVEVERDDGSRVALLEADVFRGRLRAKIRLQRFETRKVEVAR